MTLRAAPVQTLPTAFHVMTKPIGPICNLDCTYCFYLEKENLYERPPSWQMPDDVLESYIRQYIGSQRAPEVSFAWQGGEPTLLGVRFFRRVVELQKKYANGKRIQNAFQTNGTLLDDEWCDFFRENNFLIGLSVDGPRELHDAYRVDKQGRPTFDAVMRGLDFLKKHEVEYNTLTVVNRKNSERPLEVYRFLKEIGSGFIQFIPLVERSAHAPLQHEGQLLQISLAAPPKDGEERSPVTEWSVRSAQYGAFLTQIFDEWVRNDVGRTYVQLFDVALGNWIGMGGSLCVFSETCGSALAIEHNGDVYACDHYVYPEYRRGNVREGQLAEMVASPEQVKFGTDKRDTLPEYCRQCEVRFACHGECPKHRFLRAPDGEWGLNYLCAGYKRFFTHIDPYMRTMADLLHHRRAPMEIMDLLRAREGASRAKSTGRNDPCPCGSGKKYKKCCLV
ncbi:MAG: anaerobic sulfatase-maturation protein [Armatimonadetes bacterium]|nr:anaerobic sulfatase-maturation protein [Armatimonadota bacterium]